jgi:hypothetical protein
VLLRCCNRLVSLAFHRTLLTNIGNGSVPIDSSQCNMACKGNSSETCGGSSMLNLYVASDLESTQACGYLPPPAPSSSSTLTPSLCTSTSVASPTPNCEYKCGSWCSSPLPSFTDAVSCKTAASNCAVQLASCFLNAGYPDSLNCFKYAS